MHSSTTCIHALVYIHAFIHSSTTCIHDACMPVHTCMMHACIHIHICMYAWMHTNAITYKGVSWTYRRWYQLLFDLMYINMHLHWHVRTCAFDVKVARGSARMKDLYARGPARMARLLEGSRGSASKSASIYIYMYMYRYVCYKPSAWDTPV